MPGMPYLVTVPTLYVVYLQLVDRYGSLWMLPADPDVHWLANDVLAHTACARGLSRVHKDAEFANFRRGQCIAASQVMGARRVWSGQQVGALRGGLEANSGDGGGRHAA